MANARTFKREVQKAQGQFVPAKYRPRKQQAKEPTKERLTFFQWLKKILDEVKYPFVAAKAKRLKGEARAQYLLDKGLIAVPSWVKSDYHRLSWAMNSRSKAFWYA